MACPARPRTCASAFVHLSCAGARPRSRPSCPRATEATLKVVLDERERAVYDAVRAATQAELVASMSGADEKGFSVNEGPGGAPALAQAACHRGLLPGQKADSSGKVEAFARIPGDRRCRRPQGTGFLTMEPLCSTLLSPALNNAGIPYTRLDGSTRDRGEVVEKIPVRRRPARHADFTEGRRHRTESHRR